MIILSEESFSRIEPLISDDYKRTRSRLALLLQPDECEIFAGVDLLPNRGKWMTDAQVRPYADASQVEREQIAAFLEEKRTSITSRLADKLPYAADLFKIPDENQIFWYKDATGSVRVVLSQWGFRRINQKGDTDVIEFLISQPRTMSIEEVTFRAIYSDRQPMASTPFGLNIFNNSTSFTTDANGEHFIGKVPVGQHFEVAPEEGATTRFDVTAGRQIYELIVDRFTDYAVTVVGQHNTPVPNYPITIDGHPFTTDESGRVTVKGVKLTGNDSITVDAEHGQQTAYPLVGEASENNFVYRVTLPEKEPKEEKKEPDIVPPTPPTPEPAKPVRVRILDIDGSPLDNVTVYLDQPGGKTISAVTDSEGYATFPRDTFVHKKKSKLRFSLSREYQEKRAAARQQNNPPVKK